MKNKYLAAGFTFLLLSIILLFTYLRTAEDEALADRVAPSILRFHVVANSDSDEDQDLKLQVKELLLNHMADNLASASDADEVRTYVTKHKAELEETAEAYMASMGYDYRAEASLTREYFPTKTYGDMVFPCGVYEALKITLGEGEGHNWWCVLYPPMCFIDITYGVVPDSSKELLMEKLDPADYQALTLENRRNLQIQYRLRLLEAVKKER